MILNLMLSFINMILTLIFGWIPVVTTLPTINGIDTDAIFNSIFNTIHGIITIMPPFEIIYYCVITYYLFKMALLTFDFTRWIIGLIRG
jgi:hypothetical protein